MTPRHSAVVACFVLVAGLASGQDTATLSVVGVRGKSVTVSVADLQALSTRTLQVAEEGPFPAATVRAEARDGNRVAFSLVELDATIVSSEVFVAFQLDGKTLPAEVGPFRLIVPTDKRGARWIRQLSRVVLVEVGPAS